MKSKYLNVEVREAIKARGLKHCDVADALGISAVNFSVWLQSELSKEKKRRVLKAVRSCKPDRGGCKNEDVRAAMKEKGLAAYEVANELHINPGTFSHWMQTELSPERKDRVLAAIRNAKK